MVTAQTSLGLHPALDPAGIRWRGCAARTPAEQSEVAWGAGFRYLIARQYGLRTGIDVAFSEHEQAVYCNVGSGL